MADVDVDVIVEAISKGFDKVAADMKQVGAASQDTGKKVSGMSAMATAAGVALGGLALGGLAMVGKAFMAAGEAAAAFAAESVSLASDLAETTSLINNSLGPAAENYRAQLEAISEATGRSANALEMGAQTIVAMSRSMGMAQDEAADFSATMANIALDLGSFFNVEPAQVFEDLQSALAGSSETMQKYGIDVREAALQQIGLEMGFISLGEKMTQSERAWAVQIGIMRQAADAMGDATRTADGFANSQRALQDIVLDFKLAIGNALLPALTDSLNVLKDLADGVLPELAAALAPQLTDAAEKAADKFADLASSLDEGDIQNIATAFVGLADAIATVGIMSGKAISWVSDLMSVISDNPKILDYIAILSTMALGPAGLLLLGRMPENEPPIVPELPSGADRAGRSVRGGGGGFRTSPGETGMSPLDRGEQLMRAQAYVDFQIGRIPDWDAIEQQAAAAAKAAAIAFNDTFGQSLSTEGGLNIEEMLLGAGLDMGLPLEQIGLLGEAVGYTSDQLRQAAVDALVWQEAMRLMGEVDEGKRSIESMQTALENFRTELENWELEVPAIEVAGSRMSRDAMLGFENIVSDDTQTRVAGLRTDVDAISGTHTVTLESNATAIQEELRPVEESVSTLSKGATIPLTIDLRYSANSEGWLIETLDNYFANQGATP